MFWKALSFGLQQVQNWKALKMLYNSLLVWSCFQWHKTRRRLMWGKGCAVCACWGVPYSSACWNVDYCHTEDTGQDLTCFQCSRHQYWFFLEQNTNPKVLTFISWNTSAVLITPDEALNTSFANSKQNPGISCIPQSSQQYFTTCTENYFETKKDSKISEKSLSECTREMQGFCPFIFLFASKVSQPLGILCPLEAFAGSWQTGIFPTQQALTVTSESIDSLLLATCCLSSPVSSGTESDLWK